MIRNRISCAIAELAESLGEKSDNSLWYLFGSVNRGDEDAADIDILIICKNDGQADILRNNIDPDCLGLPLHLSFMTLPEAQSVDAINTQEGRLIYPAFNK